MSPKTKARLIGLLLLLTMVGGGFAQGFVGGKLISGDVSATATRIMANESLYRLAFTIYLVEMSCQIAMMVLLYDLLKPVSRTASALAVVFGLVGCTIKTLARLFSRDRIADIAQIRDNSYQRLQAVPSRETVCFQGPSRASCR